MHDGGLLFFFVVSLICKTTVRSAEIWSAVREWILSPARVSPRESNRQKSKVFPSTCSLWSSLTASLMHPKRCLSICLSHTERKISFRQKLLRFPTYFQKSARLVGSEPWSFFKISTSGVKSGSSGICFICFSLWSGRSHPLCLREASETNKLSSRPQNVLYSCLSPQRRSRRVHRKHLIYCAVWLWGREGASEWVVSLS